MSKAEEFAYSKYPKDKKGGLYDLARNSIIQGYHQAEEDLELTWKDIKLIIDIVDSENLKPHLFDEIDYQEVLKQFKNMKDGSKRYKML